MTNLTDLLPCPFCGESNALVLPRTCEKDSPYNPADSAAPRVRCMTCFAEVPGQNWKAPETAVAAWQARAALAPKEPEPVAWMFPRRYGSGVSLVRPADYADEDGNLVQPTPLYASPPIPAGMVLVPVEPTEAMLKAGWDVEEIVTPGKTWDAMLAAAPKGAA